MRSGVKIPVQISIMAEGNDSTVNFTDQSI